MSDGELTIDDYQLVNCVATGNVSQVNESASAAAVLSYLHASFPVAVAAGTPTTTSINTDLVGGDTDFVDMVMVCITGVNAGFNRRIESFTGTGGICGFAAKPWPSAASANDIFVVIGRIE